MITKYEMKKILCRKGTQIALLVLLIISIVYAFVSINSVEWTQESGKKIKGTEAIKIIRGEERKLAGEITEEKVADVIRAYQVISNNSKDGSLDEDGWIKIQYLDSIVTLVDASYGKYNDFNYYLIGTLDPDESDKFYSNRVNQLESWIKDDQLANRYTENEKEFLLKSANTLETPFFFEYMGGWDTVISDISLLLYAIMIILCILMAPVFCGEYQSNMDVILHTCQYGKSKVARSKIISSFIICTVTYWINVLIYSIITFSVFGTEGAHSQIQVNTLCWKSLYHVTNMQAYMIILVIGYVGSLLMASLTLIVSAFSKSLLQTIIIPFVLLLLPQMIDSSNFSPIVSDIFCLLPSNTAKGMELFQTYVLYDVGGKVFTQIEAFLIVYTIFIAVMIPFTLKFYRQHKIQ